MVKKATRSKSLKRSSRANDDSQRFLTVFQDDEEVTGEFHITEALENAKEAQPTGMPSNKQEKKIGIASDFEQLQAQIIDRIAMHRSLDDILAMLHVANVELQFRFAIQPVLKKFATLAHKGSDRRIYSFDQMHARELISAIRRASSGVKGVTQLPKLVLIGLISEYDVFLHDLIRIGLTVKSDVVTTIDRSLDLQELLNFSSIKEATDFLIEKEIDSILHDDHKEQLLAVGKLFNIKIATDDPSVKQFLEICERRNLFTHNAGIVNERYMNKCTQFKIDTTRVKLGDELRVDRKYFQQAIESTQELSVKLTQFVWRKLLPNQREQADRSLNNAALELLAGDDYKLAERLLDYGIHHTGPSTDAMRRMMIVNYANAIKLGGDRDRANAELAKHDWSATSTSFQISVAAIRDDISTVVRRMKAAVKSGELSEEELRNWPVFKKARGEKTFQDEFKKIFGRDLLSAVSLDKSPSATTVLDVERIEPHAKNEESLSRPVSPSGKTRH